MDISKYLEIPYVWDGRGWEGIDCYGLMVLWFKEELGITLWDPLELRLPNWRNVDASNVLHRSTFKDWKRIDPDRDGWQRHDGLLIRLPESENANHCGIVMNPYEFLHAQEIPGVNVSKLKLWRGGNRIVGYYRHLELCHDR